MANPRQLRNLIFGLSLGAATAALAIAFVLIVVATQPAQAQTFNVLHNFTGAQDGGNPYAGVTMDKAGNLYGTAFHYGAGYGTVYQLKHKGSGWVFNPLYSFTAGSDGAYPAGGVIFGPNGTLYGTTYEGGKGYGTVFNLRPKPTACLTALCGWGETVLYRFVGYPTDGAYPGYTNGDLIFDQAGKIYGTTENGGSHSYGVVYELTPSGSGWTESVLYNFSGSDGAYPYSGVIFDNAGNLYGTTFEGGLGGVGTVFELTYSIGWTETFLNSFRNGTDGSYLIAGLIFDQSGNLFGATNNGGQGGGGTVFKLTPSNGSWTYSLVYSFTGGAECGPWGNLVMDGAGNLYGTTVCDGAKNAGSVFELTPSGSGWTYTSLHDFTGGSDGALPYCNVVFDANGNLYGTAYAGGSQGVGVVWKITFP